ncbi:alpha/beta fold hydrolase [Parapedobacter tibetensis]|uniref:alpha/beta fold hydrolase n=1 Tax=Parapedobacter tibetensis TaxID=2972951 RepID=UPI00214D60ED|nr:alpha/beta hydrolase [Parapedobacter tibetensis]
MPVIKVNGLAIHMQELNPQGTLTVVLIHGMFSNLSVYYFNIAALLAQHFHVLMYDLRSHGLSEEVNSGYGLADMSDDFKGLLDYLHLPEVYVVGYSFGGLIALKSALRFPDRVKRLAIIDTPDPADQQTRDVINVYSREFLENYIANYTDTTRFSMGKRQLEKNHRKYEFLFHQTTMKADMLRDQHFMEAENLGAIRHALLIYGKQSNCLHAAKKLQERLGDSTLQLLDGDHNIPIQQPDAVGSALVKYFIEKR